MAMNTFYVEKDTPIHRINPINKLYYTITIILTSMIVSNIYFSLICIGLNIVILLIAKIFKKTIPIIGFSLIVISTIMLIQGFFYHNNSTALFSIGFLTYYKEGFIYALSISLNIINLILSFSVLVLATKPSDLIESLVSEGLNPKIGYVLSSVFQIIPEMMTTMGTITDAQRSRGLEVEGNLITRTKAFIPLIGPVVMNSLLSTRERAMAIEVRGFNSKIKKSFLNEIKKGRYDKLFQIMSYIMIILSIVWRVSK